MTTFNISVSYTQVAVFLSSLEKPYNNWSERHVAQGFSWRPGSVSFRAFDDGDIEISVSIQSEYRESMAAERIIRVPFHVPPNAIIEIGSIFDTTQVEVPSGDYAVIFEHGRAVDEKKMWCNLILEPSQLEVREKIIRADPELTPEDDLLMFADPA